ncbi:hypothetical protein GQX73_g9804 [Xylaria multiplex]|uniref:Uncharacterized protein n=1 Tax=Xylaria multiplex TaxID=323545 RepID=A0A7C8IM13_9PEZI|nr:hypothetical protein GQX73_g9804 [Xylaria multiplex]
MSRPLSSTPLRRICGRALATRIPRRHNSTTTAITMAEEAAMYLLTRFKGTTYTAKQILDGPQLQKLSLTLGRRELHPGLDISERPPPDGTAVPPGYHLVYFTPSGIEDELGADGTDARYNPPPPFTRRMWAGGRMRWSGGGLDLKVEGARWRRDAPRRGLEGLLEPQGVGAC